MMIEWTYDVFLSFRGKDIRQRFIGHLYEALHGRGFHTFLDDEELERGEDITRSLLTAVEESRIAIPVFTANYATSSFCLDELVNIMECAKAKGQIVLPVFYEVDPFHVRRLRGSYGETLAKHEERFKSDEGSLKGKNMEKLEKWKMALKQAANLSGYHFKLGGESEREFIKKIVNAVSKWIRRASLHVSDHLVGLEFQVLEVNSLLDVGFDDGVYMVGIHGIGGIGKTTLARAVYNSIAGLFEGVCFLGNVRESSMTYGLVYLQKMLLSKLVGDRDIELGDINEGISMIKHKLCRKKVLLIVDDVDNVKQLKAIVGDSKWFGSGSRVIITTRNTGLLASHGVKRTYEVGNLNKKESRDLLIWNAFKTNEVDPSYAGILNRVVTFASGLPLALEVIGSNLFGKSKEEWESALEQYKRIPNKEIQQILKVSFDDLEEDEKKFFLDIACFFNGNRLEYVKKILRVHHGVCPKNGIRVLVDKSLLKIDDDEVTLHDLIQDMGREIVRQESPEEPGKRSRMWFFEDIKRVLEENKGSSKIEIIEMVFPNFGEKVNWDGEAFKHMDNLRTLIIHQRYQRCFSERPKKLPNSLRVLKWPYYPSQFLPFGFYPKKLAILDLSGSCLLNSLETQEKFVNLRFLKIDDCKLEHIPDISFAPKLEELSFRRCKNLIEVHESVGLLDKLRGLDAYGCCQLRSFPALMLPSLEELYLSHCSSLEIFPEILGKMENLTNLELVNTPIKEFPFSIQYITRLQRLVLRFSRIVQLPSSIFVLTELKHLSIEKCNGLLLCVQHEGEEQMSSMVSSNQLHLDFRRCNVSDEFLQIGVPWFANVKRLDLSINKFTVLPACIKLCSFLKELILDHCGNLKEIRGIPPNIEMLSARRSRLKDLDLSLLPACTKECHFLKELILDGCKNLKEIRGIPPNIEVLHAPISTSLISSCRSMLLNQDLQWFKHSSMGSAISFWFRNKFPAVSLCVIGEQSYTSFSLKLIINNHEVPQFSTYLLRKDHILMLALGQKLIKFKDDVHNVLLENEWNHVELSNNPVTQRLGGVEPDDTMRIGLNVFKQSDSMEDIQFTNPLLKKEEHRVSLSLLPPLALNDNVNWDSNSMVSNPISISTTFQEQPLGDGYCNSDFVASACTIDNINDIASEDHLAKAPEESSQAPAVAEIQHVQAPSHTSSDGKVSGQEIPLIQDNVEMEAFYASLDVGTHFLSHSYDKSATTAPNEEAKEALKLVQEFISNDASVLLHPEQCSVMKASLDYLSSLSVGDGISEEMKTLISEALWLFTHCSRDYIEASMKIKFTASELQRVDELEASLEANKNQFREVVALENELLQRLGLMEKSKKELEEQINAIKANLSAYELEKKIAVQRKRDIFVGGKTLKSQIDELSKKVPCLQHEQGLAKKTQANIAAEWSKLGEKFKTIVV